MSAASISAFPASEIGEGETSAASTSGVAGPTNSTSREKKEDSNITPITAKEQKEGFRENADLSKCILCGKCGLVCLTTAQAQRLIPRSPYWQFGAQFAMRWASSRNIPHPF